MMVQITVRIDEGAVQNLTVELSGSAQELEKQALQRIADQTSAPCCCGHTMKNRSRRAIGVQSIGGEFPVARRRYRCLACGYAAYPADARYCCGPHHLTQPLTRWICQLATVEHFTRLPELVAAQHGVKLCHETIWELVHEVSTAADNRRDRHRHDRVHLKTTRPYPAQRTGYALERKRRPRRHRSPCHGPQRKMESLLEHPGDVHMIPTKTRLHPHFRDWGISTRPNRISRDTMR